MLIQPVSLTQDVQLLDVPVAYTRRSDIHLLTARRNAWNNTMLNRYSINAPAYSTVTSALESAERRRKPGTYFEIDELPSLVFDLDGVSMVVTHLNASRRFGSWTIPAAMTDRNSPITGLEVFNMFAASRYRETTSGWGTSLGEPDVLVGIIKSSALETSFGQNPIALRRTLVQSGGKMDLSIARSSDGSDPHIERIIEGLGHLTEQKYPAHDIHLWAGEYFCKKDYDELYHTELKRIFDHGWPLRLTEAPDPPAFCSVCLRWFSGVGADDVG